MVDPNTGSRSPEAVLMPSSAHPDSGAVIMVKARNVSIEGFTIIGSNPSLSSGGVGLNGIQSYAYYGTNADGQVSGLTISTNMIRDVRAGIAVQRGSSAVDGVMVDHNRFQNIQRLANGGGEAVSLVNMKGVTVRGNDFSECFVGVGIHAPSEAGEILVEMSVHHGPSTTHGLFGVIVYENANAIIRHNQFLNFNSPYNSAGVAVYGGGHDVEISNNTVTGAYDMADLSYGFLINGPVDSVGQVRVIYNSVSGVRIGLGVNDTRGGLLVRYNTFDHNTLDGIRINDDTHLTILGNNITRNGYAGIESIGTIGDVKAVSNNIFGNVQYRVRNSDNQHPLDANNNWWGNNSGPGAPGSSGNGKLLNYANVDQITLRVYYDPTSLPSNMPESILRLYWWAGNIWSSCTESGVSTSANYVWVNIREDIAPSLLQLTGTVFGVGAVDLNLAPDTGAMGTLVTITGTGFSSNDSVEVLFNGTHIATGTTNGLGELVNLSMVIKMLVPGLYNVTVTDSHGAFGIAQFTVTNINATVVSINGTVALVHTDLGNTNVTASEIHTTVISIQGVNATVRTDLGTTIVALTDIHATVISIQGVNATVRTDLGTTIVALTDIQATLVSINGTMVQVHTAVGDIQTTLSSVNAVLVSFQDTNATVNTTLGTITTSLSSIDAKVVSVQGSTANTTTTISNVTGEILVVENGIATINTPIGQVKLNVTGMVADTPKAADNTWLIVLGVIAAVVAAVAVLFVVSRNKNKKDKKKE